MILCVCNALKEKDVQSAVCPQTCNTVGAVFKKMGCKPQCGKCVCFIKERVFENQNMVAATVH
jgi:bacterioferritin-associated ferredoxin